MQVACESHVSLGPFALIICKFCICLFNKHKRPYHGLITAAWLYAISAIHWFRLKRKFIGRTVCRFKPVAACACLETLYLQVLSLCKFRLDGWCELDLSHLNVIVHLHWRSLRLLARSLRLEVRDWKFETRTIWKCVFEDFESRSSRMDYEAHN